MLPVALHAFEVDLDRVDVVVVLDDQQRLGRKRVDDALEAVRELVSTPRSNGVALLAAASDLRVADLAAVGNVLSAADWRVLLLVVDSDPEPPPLGVLRWQTVQPSSASTVAELAQQLDAQHAAGRACVRVEVPLVASQISAASPLDVPSRGPVSVLEVRFGGTVRDAWFSMGGGTCEPGLAPPSVPGL